MQLPIPRGESGVTKNLVNCFLLLLALLMAYFAFRRWQKSKRLWYIISIVAAVLSGFDFWLSWPNGFVLLVSAALMFGLGELLYPLNKWGRMGGVRAAPPPAHPPFPFILRCYELFKKK